MFDAIASGGMATVHLGKLEGPAGFTRTVAIKRLHENLARDASFVAMMIDEARIVSRIDHPNVVATVDVVQQDGELFLVMDYVSGASLDALVKKGKLPVGIAVAIVTGVLHGLHAAHEAKGENDRPLEIVHRDVSPQNVLVGTDGIARVADFGIAKAIGRVQSTTDGSLKGKAAYMAPEQIAGKPIDRRADVWAAGVVLWELLAGKRLFDFDDPLTTMNAAATAPIDPPSTHDPDLPPELDAIVLRALERDPEKRFATAHDFAVALEDALPLPRAHEIGAWVAEHAGAELADRTRLVQAIETAPTAIAPKPSRTGAKWAIALGIAGLASAAAAWHFGTSDRPMPSPPPPGSIEAKPEPTVSLAPPPSTSSVVSAPAPVRTAPKSVTAPNCDPPYRLDKSGVKIPKPECMH